MRPLYEAAGGPAVFFSVGAQMFPDPVAKILPEDQPAYRASVDNGDGVEVLPVDTGEKEVSKRGHGVETIVELHLLRLPLQFEVAQIRPFDTALSYMIAGRIDRDAYIESVRAVVVVSCGKEPHCPEARGVAPDIVVVFDTQPEAVVDLFETARAHGDHARDRARAFVRIGRHASDNP